MWTCRESNSELPAASGAVCRLPTGPPRRFAPRSKLLKALDGLP